MFPHRPNKQSGEPTRRVEEILEIDEVLNQAADGIAAVLERSGADKLHPPDVLRQMARYELDLAAVDIAGLTFGSRPDQSWR